MFQPYMLEELGYPETTLFARGARLVASGGEFINLQPMAGNRVTVLSIKMMHNYSLAATVFMQVAGVTLARIIMQTGEKFELVSLPKGMIVSGGGEAVIFSNVSGLDVSFVWVVAYLDGSKYAKGD